jgi:hypothetical protein
MKKTLFLVCFSLQLYSFSMPVSDEPFKRFYLGFGGSLDICDRTLKVNGISNPAYDDIISNRNYNEIPKLGFSGGAQLGYLLKKRFGLELGIQYANMGYETKWSLMSNYSNPYENVKTRYNFHHILIPLKANLFLGERRLKFMVGAGVAAGFFVYERRTILYKDQGNSKTDVNHIYNPFNLFVLASAGADLKLSERVHFRIEPYYRYGLLQILNSPITAYLWNGGVNAGLTFEL